MSTLVSVPLEWMETVSELKLPARAGNRLHDLMDRNTEGQLNEVEREELEALVELSESLSLVRSGALHLLGRRPQ